MYLYAPTPHNTIRIALLDDTLTNIRLPMITKSLGVSADTRNPKTVPITNKRTRRETLSLNKATNSPTTQAINKTSSENTPTSRVSRKAIGASAMAAVAAYVDLIAPVELSWPRCIDTYEQMMQDATISLVLNKLQPTFVEKAFKEGEYAVSFNSRSAESKRAAEFLKWNLLNMDRSMKNVMRDVLKFEQQGFSVLEKVYEQETEGQYAGMVKVKNLANRPHRTLDSTFPFEIPDDGNRITHVVQNTSYYNSRYLNASSIYRQGNAFKTPTDTYARIPINKCMIFGDTVTESNPLGMSALFSLYKVWKEKRIIEEYETVGVTKDMGGVLELQVPAEILIKAAADPSGPEGRSLDVLKRNAANAHAGEQSYFIIPSDPHENSASAPQYGIKLKGIEGGGKQYSTTDLVRERKKSILDRFGAGFINLGNDGGGSYALSSDKTSLYAHFIEHTIEHIIEVFNRSLFPQLLALNQIRLTQEDMPQLVAGEIEESSPDTASKVIQRVKSVNGLVLTKSIILQYHKKLGFDISDLEDLSLEQLKELMGSQEDVQSRAGDGMTTPFQGTSTGGGNSNDASVANNENGGVEKSVSVMKDDGEILTLSNGLRVLKEDAAHYLGTEDKDT